MVILAPQNQKFSFYVQVPTFSVIMLTGTHGFSNSEYSAPRADQIPRKM